jgi:hypothetical protein
VITLPANLETPYVTVKEEETTPRSVFVRPSPPWRPKRGERKEGRRGER